jgi:hypothetical protein
MFRASVITRPSADSSGLKDSSSLKKRDYFHTRFQATPLSKRDMSSSGMLRSVYW